MADVDAAASLPQEGAAPQVEAAAPVEEPEKAPAAAEESHDAEARDGAEPESPKAGKTRTSLQYEDAAVMAAAKRLDDPKEHHRFNALMRLHHLDPHILAVFGEGVAKCLADEKSSIAWLAVKTLAKLSAEDFLSHAVAITASLKGSHPLVRQALVEVFDKVAPKAPEFEKARKDVASMFRSEASQVRVWLLKREEERRAQEANEYAKIQAERQKNEEETRRKRIEWEAEKRAKEEAKAAAAHETEWKQSAEQNAEVRQAQEMEIQKALDAKAESSKEVAVDLADKEQEAIAQKLQEAKELAEKKKLAAPKKDKKAQSKSPSPAAGSARAKAAERAKQRGQ